MKVHTINTRNLTIKYSNTLFEKTFARITKKAGSKTPLFCDIETFKSNTLNAIKHKTDFSVHTWSLCIGLLDENGTAILAIYKTFKDFFSFLDQSIEQRSKMSKKPRLEFLFHNGQGYDAHFFLSELTEYTNKPSFNKFIMKAQVKEMKAKKQKDIAKTTPYEIHESRVKSKSKLTLSGRLSGYDFETVDTLPKFQSSLREIGKTLNKQNLIPKKVLKTEMDYTQFDTSLYLSEKKVNARINKIWRDYVTDKHIEYILNDVILMIFAYMYYNVLYPDFDFDKFSLSTNIGEHFTQYSELSAFQLAHDTPKDFDDIKPADVLISREETLRQFTQSFYHGGFNAYNDDLIETHIKDAFSMDSNQHYPTQMYKEKFPTYLIKTDENVKIKISNLTDERYFYLVRIERPEFAKLLSKVKSKKLRQFYIKRFGDLASPSPYINLTSIDLKHFSPRHMLHIVRIHAYETERFDAREFLFDNFKVKSQAKISQKDPNKTITYSDPFTYVIENKPPKIMYTANQVRIAKLLNNSIYGYTVLRAYYPLAYKDRYQEYHIEHNGVKMSERNNIFGLTVTSWAFYRLIEPLKCLTDKEIDKYFLYCDTDSLYLRRGALPKVKHFFDSWALGGWDLEHEISDMWINNHKKYMIKDKNTGELIIHAGGVSYDAQESIVNSGKTFEEITKEYLSTGSTFKTTKSILTKELTMAIYESETRLSPATKYPDKIDAVTEFMAKLEYHNAKQVAKERDNSDDMLYYEGIYGAYSASELLRDPQSEIDASKRYDIRQYMRHIDEVKFYFRTKAIEEREKKHA